jgi:hypothetical protein
MNIDDIQAILIGVVNILQSLSNSITFKEYSKLFTTSNDLEITDALQVLLEINAELEELKEPIELRYRSTNK